MSKCFFFFLQIVNRRWWQARDHYLEVRTVETNRCMCSFSSPCTPCTLRKTKNKTNTNVFKCWWLLQSCLCRLQKKNRGRHFSPFPRSWRPPKQHVGIHKLCIVWLPVWYSSFVWTNASFQMPRSTSRFHTSQQKPDFKIILPLLHYKIAARRKCYLKRH